RRRGFARNRRARRPGSRRNVSGIPDSVRVGFTAWRSRCMPRPTQEVVAMKAAVMEGIRQPLVVREVPDPKPPEGGVVVRVEANGICRSDWHLWNGDWSWLGVGVALPHVLGHEFCGVVDEVGADVRRWKKGDRV